MFKYLRRLPILIRIKHANQRAFSSKYLLYTNVAISMTLSTAGDAMEQHYQRLFGETRGYDKRRSIRMGCSGFSVGIACHYWYKFIDKRLPGRTIGLVLKKVLLDQVIGSPINIAVLFVTLGLLEQRTVSEMGREIREKFVRLYTAEWIVWPPAQIVNFLWLNPKYRVLYDNTISLGYDIYTSRVANDEI